MSEDIKNLVEQLSSALGDALRESEKVRSVLRKIEESGADMNITLAIVLGVHGQVPPTHCRWRFDSDSSPTHEVETRVQVELRPGQGVEKHGVGIGSPPNLERIVIARPDTREEKGQGQNTTHPSPSEEG